jgi:hypothetical protein
MCKIVAKAFLKILLVFVVMLTGFGFAFHIMNRDVITEKKLNTANPNINNLTVSTDIPLSKNDDNRNSRSTSLHNLTTSNSTLNNFLFSNTSNSDEGTTSWPFSDTTIFGNDDIDESNAGENTTNIDGIEHLLKVASLDNLQRVKRSTNVSYDPSDSSDSSDPFNKFQSPELVIAKIISMFTGEFDAASMEITWYKLLIFVLFVFSQIVVFNLMNALAIDDIEVNYSQPKNQQ